LKKPFFKLLAELMTNGMKRNIMKAKMPFNKKKEAVGVVSNPTKIQTIVVGVPWM